MTKSDMYLSVIVPAYNEEERIETPLRRIGKYLEKQAYTYEILVVIDGAKDDTAGVIKKLIPHIPNLRLIDRKKNRGKGYTVREGMAAAHGKIRLFTDADNSTDISHFEKMRPFFDKGYDVVISSRNPWDAKGASQDRSQPIHKRIMGMMGNLFIQIMAVPGIWDTQNGFKAFRDFAAEEIFPRAKIDRWGFDIEALALARALQYKIGIIPVHWIDDARSHVKLSAYLEVLWETVKVRLNLLTNRYNL